MYFVNVYFLLKSYIFFLFILGAGLAFIVYPEAVSRLPVARFWAIIFFVMLSTLGFGTQFTLIESVASTVSEMFFNRPNRQIKRRILMMTCFTFFIFGLILSTHVWTIDKLIFL